MSFRPTPLRSYHTTHFSRHDGSKVLDQPHPCPSTRRYVLDASEPSPCVNAHVTIQADASQSRLVTPRSPNPTMLLTSSWQSSSTGRKPTGMSALHSRSSTAHLTALEKRPRLCSSTSILEIQTSPSSRSPSSITSSRTADTPYICRSPPKSSSTSS